MPVPLQSVAFFFPIGIIFYLSQGFLALSKSYLAICKTLIKKVGYILYLQATLSRKYLTSKYKNLSFLYSLVTIYLI